MGEKNQSDINDIIILKGINEYIASFKQEQHIIQKKISEAKLFLKCLFLKSLL